MQSKQQSTSGEYKAKESMYSLFYEWSSEIKGQKIEIDEDEFKQNIQSIKMKQLIEYIRDSIQIWIKKKIEETLSQTKNNIKSKATINNFISDTQKYENLLRYFESRERKLIKRQFQNKLRKEAMENKIEEYIDMEEEFEEMKTKVKYDNGKFLTNERKDNEIIIIRSENSNLKKIITTLENKVSKLESKIDEKDQEIYALTEANSHWKHELDDMQKELNLSASNINININNANSPTTNNITQKISAYNTNNNSVIDEGLSPKLKIYSFQKIQPVLSRSKVSTTSNHNFNPNIFSNSINNNSYGANTSRLINTYKNNPCEQSIGDLSAKYINQKNRSNSTWNINCMKISRRDSRYINSYSLKHSNNNSLNKNIGNVNYDSLTNRNSSLKVNYSNNNSMTNTSKSNSNPSSLNYNNVNNNIKVKENPYYSIRANRIKK